MKKNEKIIDDVIENNSLEVLNYLKNGGDVNFFDSKKFFLLHYAVLYESFDVIKVLFQYGVDINAVDGDGYVPLEIAINNKYSNIIEFLLKKNPDLKYYRNGFSLLHAAAAVGDNKVINYLIKNGLKNEINKKDNDGKDRTPLHWSTQEGYFKTIKLLIKHGADYNCKEESGYTPLHIAASEGYYKIVKYLLTLNVDVNSQTDDGSTALHFACSWGYKNIAKLLINYGADLTLKDTDEMNAKYYAMSNRYLEIAKLFE